MSRRRWMALGGLLALVVVAGSVLAFSLVAHEPASAFVPSGSGSSPLVAEARAQGDTVQRLLSGPQWLAQDPGLDPAHTLLVVVHPEKGYTAGEAAAFRSFLERGGHALVADTFGTANDLTQPLGITFYRDRLVESDPSRSLNATLESQSFHLGAGKMTALHLADGLGTSPVAVASSSPTSFLDLRGDGLIDASDPHGPFPVAVEVPVGTRGGALLALGTLDPLLAGSQRAETSDWLKAVVQHLLPEGGRVVVDESRAGSPDPFLALVATVAGAASSWPWRQVVGVLGILPLIASLLPHRDDEWGPHRFRPHRFIRRALLGASETPAADRSPSTLWTRRGTAALLGGAGLLGLCLVAQSRQAAYAGAFLLVAALAALLLRAPAVRATRTLSARQVAESAPLAVRLELEGSARHHHMELEFLDALPPEFELQKGANWFQTHLGPAPTAVEYQASPALRGPYTTGPLTVRRSDALRLRVQQKRIEAGCVVEVSPRKEPFNRSPFKTRVPTVTLGPHLVNRAGDGSEFHSLREYHDGDSFRAINWKASARSKSLVVSQRVHESRTTLTIFLDARAVSAAGPASTSPLAHGCRVVLGVASGAVQVRDRVRIILYGKIGEKDVLEMPPAPGSRQIHELTRTLSRLAAGGSTPFAKALQGVLPSLAAGTPVLLVSGLEGDPSILEGMKLVRAKGLLPTVIASPIHTAPVDAEDGQPEPHADRIGRERAAILGGLRASGVAVFDAIEGIPLEYLFRLGATA